ncbi:hypothetical protein RI129_006086 [Pyrocoelia pectoralis]|uniref:MADF domain-containing protein n=1 Tax=Pyrocoelia pectoralis TaxID=417401 RepID=A0AAN7VFU9_9COLE
MTTEVKKGNREILEDFIEIYRSEPCLWNIKAKDYHNKIKKENAYRRLIEKLKEIDGNCNKDKVVKKINSLRTNHRKEKKKVDDIFIQYVRQKPPEKKPEKNPGKNLGKNPEEKPPKNNYRWL